MLVAYCSFSRPLCPPAWRPTWASSQGQRGACHLGTAYWDRAVLLKRYAVLLADDLSVCGGLETTCANFCCAYIESCSTPKVIQPMCLPLAVAARYKGHFATWQSAVLGIASVGALRKLRADIRAQGPSAARAPPPTPAGPKPKTPSGIEYIKHPAVRSYSVPFPGLHPIGLPCRHVVTL